MKTGVQPERETDCMDGCCPTRPRSAATAHTDDAERRLAALARALAHPARVKILKLLIDRNTCVAGTLSDALPLAPSTVSQHLRVLKQAGLIMGEADGPRRCYCVDHAALSQLKALIADL